MGVDSRGIGKSAAPADRRRTGRELPPFRIQGWPWDQGLRLPRGWRETWRDCDKHTAFMVCDFNDDRTDAGLFTDPFCGRNLLGKPAAERALLLFTSPRTTDGSSRMYGNAGGVQKGRRIYSMNVAWHGKRTFLKDSLCLPRLPPSASPSVLGFEHTQSEVFPCGTVRAPGSLGYRPLRVPDDARLGGIPSWDKTTKQRVAAKITDAARMSRGRDSLRCFEQARWMQVARAGARRSGGRRGAADGNGRGATGAAELGFFQCEEREADDSLALLGSMVAVRGC
jgi:hypothetical protein